MSIADMFGCGSGIVSSFGMTARQSKRDIMIYAKNLYSGSKRMRFDFARLYYDTGGASYCDFAKDDSVCGYYVWLNNMYLDSVGCVDRRKLDMHDLRLARDRLDRAYVRTLVAAGHEISHLAQFESKDPEMALCSVAQAGNQFNYKLNRFQNRRGIMAELNAIHFAGLHMERLYPHVDRDEMLCQYVHDQIYGDQDDTRNIIRPYYIDWPEGGFKSVRDIFSAFDKAYDSAAHHVNGYSCRIPGKANDAYAKLTGLGFCRRVNPEWDFLRFALEHDKSAYESNLILASASVYVYPDIVREAAGAELPDLSIQAVFGRSAPDAPVVESASEFERKPVRSPKMAALMRKAEQAKSRDPGHDREFTD